MSPEHTLREKGAEAVAATDAALAQAGVGKRFDLPLRMAQLGLLGVTLLAWQFASGTVVDRLFISDPVSVAERLYKWTADGSIFLHTWITLYEAVAGFVIGSLVGITLGIWLGISVFTSRLLNPFILAFYALPKIALAPLFLLWFGLGTEAKVVFAAAVVFFLSFYNTFTGVRAVDRDLVDTVRLMRAGFFQVLLKVIIPSAGSWIFAGLQISVPYALIGAIVGEILAANAGLGYLLQRSGAAFDTTGIFAALTVTAVLAVVINQIVDRAQSRLESWRIVGR